MTTYDPLELPRSVPLLLHFLLLAQSYLVLITFYGFHQTGLHFIFEGLLADARNELVVSLGNLPLLILSNCHNTFLLF